MKTVQNGEYVIPNVLFVDYIFSGETLQIENKLTHAQTKLFNLNHTIILLIWLIWLHFAGSHVKNCCFRPLLNANILMADLFIDLTATKELESWFFILLACTKNI